MRHNNTYTRRRYGLGEKARSESPGTETNGNLAPSPRLAYRRSVQGESVLRPQGSASGPLRDAAPAPGRGSLDCRRGCHLRRFATHRLSDPSGFPAGGTGWTAPQAPWAPARTQAVGRSDRICASSAKCRSALNHRCLYPSRSAKVRDHGSSPQSGAGAGEQKKTSPFPVRSPIAEGSVEAYEGLRRQAVQLHGPAEYLESRVILMRRGLAAWAQLHPSIAPPRPP